MKLTKENYENTRRLIRLFRNMSYNHRDKMPNTHFMIFILGDQSNKIVDEYCIDIDNAIEPLLYLSHQNVEKVKKSIWVERDNLLTIKARARTKYFSNKKRG